MADNAQIDKLIKKLSERMGASEGDIRSAVQNSNYNRLLSKMAPSQARQLEDILGDENKARAFLDSPQAKAVIKRLMG